MANDARSRVRQTPGFGPTMRQIAEETLDEPQPQIVVQQVEVVPEGAIVPTADGFVVNNRRFTKVGGTFEGIDLDEWLKIGEALFNVESAMQWIVGGWAEHGMEHFNVKIEDIARHFNRDVKTLQNWASVNRKVPFSRRRELLDFGHHECVAALDEKSQNYWLERAAQGEGEGENWRRWSVKELRDAIRSSRRGSYQRTVPKLAGSNQKKLLQKVWKAVEGDKPVNREDIQALRRWLTEVERRLVKDQPGAIQELEYVDEDI